MSDLTILDTVRKGEITKDHRVNGIKICRDSASRLTGVRLQISAKGVDNKLNYIFTLGSLGVTDTCPNMTLVTVDGYVSAIDVYYNTFSGVNRIDVYD